MRISREQMFMEMAETAAKRSTCFRNSVGAVVVDSSNNLVAMGYNGPVAGEPHCQGKDCPLTEAGGCSRSVHAERNALYRCSSHEDLSLYVSLSPCKTCAEFIVRDNRVKKIYYRQEYRDRSSIDWLAGKNIKLYKITAGGYIVDAVTNEITA